MANKNKEKDIYNKTDSLSKEAVVEDKTFMGGKSSKKMSKQNINGIIIGMVELIVGILLLFRPEAFTRGIIITFGVILTAFGVINVVDYFRSPIQIAARERSFVSGIVMIIVGLFCAVNSKWFISTFPILTVLYGVIILLVGLSSIQNMVDLLRLKSKNWVPPCILGVLSVLFAIVIFANPFSSTRALWIFVAISIIVEAIFEIVSSLVNHFKSLK